MSDTTNKPAFGQGRLSIFEWAGQYLSARRLRILFKGKSNLDVLDVGCGYRASLLRALDAHLRSGTGIDRHIDPSLQGGKYTFYEGEIEAILPQLASSHFDAVLVINTLEHLWEPIPVLRECHRVLKPNGFLFVNVPTWWGKCVLEWQAFYLRGDTSMEVDDHKMYYNKRDLWPLLVRAGFRPRNIRLHYHKFGINLYAVALRAETNGGRIGSK